MSSSDRSPLQAALALARTVLLIAALLYAAVWLICQIWVWLLVLALLAGTVTVLVWWLRVRRDRW
ncbi:hypothetical protein [Microbacterium sp. VKM Ac-2923]|uniref:hypothetical protein n=1 Tax=Microbacterium sp. VKM Ac-2923 TaxID=2929476 RepID=UPI001FB2DEFB|nr:hypothetical protein [Microbacterium sp. VKM Ac-2923]MCJ1707131.1 hypothetical protein [Microbacterium sp. VKM Ac-2923]